MAPPDQIGQIVSYLLNSLRLGNTLVQAQALWIQGHADPGADIMERALIAAQLAVQAADCVNRPQPPQQWRDCLQGVQLSGPIEVCALILWHVQGEEPASRGRTVCSTVYGGTSIQDTMADIMGVAIRAIDDSGGIIDDVEIKPVRFSLADIFQGM